MKENVKESGEQYEKDQEHNRMIVEDAFPSKSGIAFSEMVANYKATPPTEYEQSVINKLKSAYDAERERFRQAAKAEQRANDIAILMKWRSLAFKDPYREALDQIINGAIAEIRES